MKGFWRTSIFTSGSGIKAALTALTHSVKIAFHKKNLMLPKQRKDPRLHRVKNMPKARRFRVSPGLTLTLPGRRGTFTTNFPTHCELPFKELKSQPHTIGSKKAGGLRRAAFPWLTVLSLRLLSSQWRCSSGVLRCPVGSEGRVQPSRVALEPRGLRNSSTLGRAAGCTAS